MQSQVQAVDHRLLTMLDSKLGVQVLITTHLSLLHPTHHPHRMCIWHPPKVSALQCSNQCLHLSACRTVHLLYDQALLLAYTRPIHSTNSIVPHHHLLAENFEPILQIRRLRPRSDRLRHLQRRYRPHLTHMFPPIKRHRNSFNWVFSTTKLIGSKNRQFALKGARKKMEGVVLGC